MKKEFTLMDYLCQETGVSEESLWAFLASKDDRKALCTQMSQLFDISNENATSFIRGVQNRKGDAVTQLFVRRMIPTIKALQARGIDINAGTQVSTSSKA